MKTKLAGLASGIGFGFILAWARISDPTAIRSMLLLREADIFLVMGSAIVLAAVGVRLLRGFGLRAFITNDPIGWASQRVEGRHIAGSIVFGAGWSVAGTCPGPAAAMIGAGKLSGLIVAAGLLAGVALHESIKKAFP